MEGQTKLSLFEREKIDKELADRIRQLEVVCKVKIQLGGCNSPGSLESIGKKEFGFSHGHTRMITARAKEFLAEVDRLDAERKTEPERILAT